MSTPQKNSTLLFHILSVIIAIFSLSCGSSNNDWERRVNHQDDDAAAFFVTQGRLAKGRAFKPEVLQVQTRINDTSSAFCTATMIAPTYLLTAAHCVTSPLMRNNSAIGIVNKVQSIPAANIAVKVEATVKAIWKSFPDSKAIKIDATSVAIARGFFERFNLDGSLKKGPVTGNFDLAIVTLSKPIELAHYAIPAATTYPKGTKLAIYGYGCNDAAPHDQSTMQMQQMGDTVVNLVIGNLIEIGGRQDVSRSCEGDSGGPSYLASDSNMIVGVHSTKAADQAQFPVSRDVNLADVEVRQFINEVVPQVTQKSYWGKRPVDFIPRAVVYPEISPIPIVASGDEKFYPSSPSKLGTIMVSRPYTAESIPKSVYDKLAADPLSAINPTVVVFAPIGSSYAVNSQVHHHVTTKLWSSSHFRFDTHVVPQGVTINYQLKITHQDRSCEGLIGMTHGTRLLAFCDIDPAAAVPPKIVPGTIVAGDDEPPPPLKKYRYPAYGEK